MKQGKQTRPAQTDQLAAMMAAARLRLHARTRGHGAAPAGHRAEQVHATANSTAGQSAGPIRRATRLRARR